MIQKVVISNRIYFRPEDELHKARLVKDLTYKIEEKSHNPKAKFKPVTIIRNYKILPQGLISIPQGRSDLIPKGSEIVDKRVYNSVPFPTPKFPLYPDQQVVYDTVNDSVFINAKVGWGKFCPTLK